MTKDLRMKDGAPDKETLNKGTLGDALRSHGVSRRSFMKFCATTASKRIVTSCWDFPVKLWAISRKRFISIRN